MKKTFILFLVLLALAPFFTSCTVVRQVPAGGGHNGHHAQRGHHPQQGGGGHHAQNHPRQQQPRGEWNRSRFEVGRDHTHGHVEVEVGSHSMSREEKIALQEQLIVKGKEFSTHTGQVPTREQFIGWGRSMESRDFDVRIQGEAGKPVFEPYDQPKLVSRERVQESSVPANIRQEAYQNLQHRGQGGQSRGGPRFLSPVLGCRQGGNQICR